MFGLPSEPLRVNTTEGVARAKSWMVLTPCWSRAFCVTAVTDTGTLLTVEGWGVAVATTSPRAAGWWGWATWTGRGGGDGAGADDGAGAATCWVAMRVIGSAAVDDAGTIRKVRPERRQVSPVPSRSLASAAEGSVTPDAPGEVLPLTSSPVARIGSRLWAAK